MYTVIISIKSPLEYIDSLSDFFKIYYLLQRQKADEEITYALLNPGTNYVIDNFIFDKFGSLFFHSINAGWISKVKYQEFNVDTQEFKLCLYSDSEQKAIAFFNYMCNLDFWKEWKIYLNRHNWVIDTSIEQTNIIKSSQELSEEWLHRPMSHYARFRFLC